MPPVSPGQPSSFGSVFADAPGLLRENGFTFTYTMRPQTAGEDMPICSGTGPADTIDFQPLIAPLNTGDSLNIYGVQAVHAGNTTPLTFALRTGAHDPGTGPILMVGTSNKNGPWFQHLELPIQIEGAETPVEVWMEIISIGSAGTPAVSSLSRITLECIVVRKAT